MRVLEHSGQAHFASPLITVLSRVHSLKIGCFCLYLVLCVFYSCAVINHGNSFLIMLVYLKTYDSLKSSGTGIGWVETIAHVPVLSDVRL